MASKVDTSVNDLLNFINKEATDPKSLIPIIDALMKTITVKKTRNPIMTDKNLNRLFNVKRIGYNALVKILPSDEQGMYTATVVKITAGETKVTEGSSLTISKRELQINGRPSSSVE